MPDAVHGGDEHPRAGVILGEGFADELGDLPGDRLAFGFGEGGDLRREAFGEDKLDTGDARMRDRVPEPFAAGHRIVFQRGIR